MPAATGSPEKPNTTGTDFAASGAACCSGVVARPDPPPKWIMSQLTRLVEEGPAGKDRVYEIKYDGYRMHVAPDTGRLCS